MYKHLINDLYLKHTFDSKRSLTPAQKKIYISAATLFRCCVYETEYFINFHSLFVSCNNFKMRFKIYFKIFHLHN